MLYVGAQYYRPPFPESKFWQDDIRRMKDSGMNTIQLWVVWAWVEAEAGRYRFEDYDRIVELADRERLSLVLSTIAAIHPFWIHTLEPGSEMIDNFGNAVISTNRRECNFGLSPGGCIDHPGVWTRMKAFIQATVDHYRGAAGLVGWDAWNELRWNVHADGLVCYCPHTLASFRGWLDKKYGGLEGLNGAWKRRHGSWGEVFPGKEPDRPYTEMMAFQEFLSVRSVEHGRARIAAVRELDGSHVVTVHGAQPTVLHGTDEYPIATALHRGNDWDFAEFADGIGCSSFPLWGGLEMDPVEVHNRFEYLRSAAGSKNIWLSELQGGRYNIGFNVGESVDAVRQQRWIWNGYAVGADKVLLWCWRDEVFGRESNGFGFIGNDGLAEERVEAMRITGRIIRESHELLSGYKPDSPRIGLFFSPTTYYLYWAQEGNAKRPLAALAGYADALTRSGLPFETIEERHLERLSGIDLLFLPRVHALSDSTAAKLLEWVEAGGRLVAESETGAFTAEGFYRYPEERPWVLPSGLQEVGRRRLEHNEIELSAAGQRFTVSASDWSSPLALRESGSGANPNGKGADERILREAVIGKGSMLFVGGYLGEAYLSAAEANRAAFQEWIATEARAAGFAPVVSLAGRVRKDSSDALTFPLFAKLGFSARAIDGKRRRIAFLFLPAARRPFELLFAEHQFPAGAAREIVTGTEVRVDGGGRVALPETPWGVAVLVAPPA